MGKIPVMEVFVSPSRDEMGKFQGLISAFPHLWDGLVLDVGCRSKTLRYALSDKNIGYYGLDLSSPADIIASLEDGLPFEDHSFRTVIGLDVLEHIDNIHRGFNELCRVSSHYVLITLPNSYEVTYRIKFLLGRQLSGKYGLPHNAPYDRHRWLFSLREARDFTHSLGLRNEFNIMLEGCLIGPRRGMAGGNLVVSLLPNLLSPWYVAVLHRKEMS
jgi:hypothetical protein